MLKSALSGASLTAIILSFSLPAIAQDEIEEIITTGTPLAKTLDETIIGFSVLTGEELTNRLAGTIGETLKSEPGVSSTFLARVLPAPLSAG